MYLRHDPSVEFLRHMEDSGPCRRFSRQQSTRNIMKARSLGYSLLQYFRLALFGVLAYFFSDFIAH